MNMCVAVQLCVTCRSGVWVRVCLGRRRSQVGVFIYNQAGCRTALLGNSLSTTCCRPWVAPWVVCVWGGVLLQACHVGCKCVAWPVVLCCSPSVHTGRQLSGVCCFHPLADLHHCSVCLLSCWCTEHRKTPSLLLQQPCPSGCTTPAESLVCLLLVSVG